MIYVIVGRSQYGKEDIDEFNTRSEALKMIKEYRLAFGAGWDLKIVGRKNKCFVKNANKIK